MTENELSHKIIGCAMKVHTALGPGLLENAYEECLFYELVQSGLKVEKQKALPLVPSLQSNWLMMHVSMMMISYATLILGSLLSILYLAFNVFNKKEKKILIKIENSQTIINPSINYSKLSLLQTIDIWSYRIIGLGFPFLTIGIISGAVWANEAWGS